MKPSPKSSKTSVPSGATTVRTDKKPAGNDKDKVLQDQLKGNTPRDEDGNFGPKTKSAVEDLLGSGNTTERPTRAA
jgi:hypothetical protein